MWPSRCAASLKAPQGPLVEFLALGRGYDDSSVAAAIRDANTHFNQKDYGRARDMFGVAYEIGRLHHAYRPLMQDLLLRRVLCHSILGDFSRALQECEMAFALIPNEASVCLLRGIVSSKLANSNDANLAFQQAVILDRDLRDLVDCMIAFFSLQHGYCDRAIKICDQVLKRSPKHSLALLLRGDAYKFHPAGWAHHKHSATNDYTSLLEADLGLQHLIIRARPGPSQHARAEELLLFFHPSLRFRSPRPYQEYELCRRRDPFQETFYVLLAVAKLRRMQRCKAPKQVQHTYEELLDQRAQIDKQIRRLVESHQRTSMSEEVSFPMDPESDLIKRYRRHWVNPEASDLSKRRISQEREAFGGLRYSAPPYKRRAEAVVLAQAAVEDWSPVQEATPDIGGFHSTIHPTALDQHASPPAVAPTRVANIPYPPTAIPESGSLSRPSALLLPPAGFAPQSRQVERAEGLSPEREWTDWRTNLHEETAVSSPKPLPVSSCTPSSRISQAGGVFNRTGEGWDDKQWFDKAMQLIETFSGGAYGHTSRPGSGRKPPLPPAAPSTQVRSKESTGKATLLRYRSGEGRLVEVNLMEAIEHHGLDVLPNWYSALDRIYEVRDMSACNAIPEPPIPLGGLLGAPGHSYVVASSEHRVGSVRGKQPSPEHSEERSAKSRMDGRSGKKIPERWY